MKSFTTILLISTLVLSSHARPSIRAPYDEVMFRETRDKNENAVAAGPAQSPVLKLKVVPPEAMSLPIGSNRVLECEAGGNPVPTIHWLKNGKRVSQSGVEDALRLDSGEESPQGILGLGFTKSRLFLDCIQPQDEGTYTCVAENAFERQSSSSHVEITQSSLALAETNDITLCTSKKSAYGSGGARINLWTKTRLELIGSEVRLFCRSQGFPKPVVTWLNPEGRTIVSNSRMTVTESGDLIIRNLSWDDMGGYQCVAKNEQGEDQSTTFLYPMSPEKS